MHESDLTQDEPMSIGDHIEELRRRMLFSLSGTAVAACVMLIIGRWLIATLCLPLNDALISVGLPPRLYTHSPPTGFTTYLKVSLVAGMVVASPWILYQAWLFIVSGLYRAERRVVITLIPFSAMMTLLGVLFMYFIMLPVCLWFFLHFTVGYPQAGDHDPGFMANLMQSDIPSLVEAGAAPGGADAASADTIDVRESDPPTPADGMVWLKVPEMELRVAHQGRVQSFVPAAHSQVSLLPELSQYLGFVAMLTIGIVVAFQLPVVMLVLGWTGVMASETVSQSRRYCIFGCFVAGALLTPADVLSMFLLAFPLWGLFEFGLLLMKLMERRRERRE